MHVIKIMNQKVAGKLLTVWMLPICQIIWLCIGEKILTQTVIKMKTFYKATEK